MSCYRRGFDKTKCMSFLIKDETFLEKYNKIWNSNKKKFNSEPGKLKNI